MNNYRDAREKRIIRPQKAKAGHRFDIWVTSASDKWQRKCFVQLRRYLAIECDVGMLMDESDECWRDIEIFSLTDYFFDEKRYENRQWLIGCVAFQIHEKNVVELTYCWIHPFWRNKNLLKQSWSDFINRYGFFYVSYPRSNAMEGFLKAVNYVEVVKKAESKSSMQQITIS